MNTKEEKVLLELLEYLRDGGSSYSELDNFSSELSCSNNSSIITNIVEEIDIHLEYKVSIGIDSLISSICSILKNDYNYEIV